MQPVRVKDLDSLLHKPVWTIRNGAVVAGLLVNTDVYPGKAGGRYVQMNPAGETHRRGIYVPLSELYPGQPPGTTAHEGGTAATEPRKPKRAAAEPTHAATPNLAQLGKLVARLVEQVNSTVVRSQLVEELEADGRPEILREVLDHANLFRMLAVDYTHVVAQAVAGADADIAIALTDLVGDLGKAGTGFSEAWVNLVDMQRELAEHTEWPPRRASSSKPAPPADETPVRPGWLARQPIAQLHIDTLRKAVAGSGGAVKIPPGVVADLVELVRTHPDSPAEDLAATCEAWCTDDGGALVPADELTQVLDNLQTEAGDGGR